MRVGFNGFPCVYFGAESTGKRIDDLIVKKLLKEPKIRLTFDVKTAQFIDLKRYDWDKAATSIEYDHHIFIKRIAASIRTFSQYDLYCMADEVSKHDFAEYVASKITDWVAERLTADHIIVSQNEGWGFGWLHSSNIQFQVTIKPPMPEDNDLPGIFRNIRFDYSDCVESTTSSIYFDL